MAPNPTIERGTANLVFACLVASLLLIGHFGSAAAQEAFADLPTDPLLEGLLRESLAALPELRGADQVVHAEAERISQANALPDPTLTLGIQNDGFRSIEIGRAETSFWRIELNQPLPWPGKRQLRVDNAKLGVERARAYVARMRLSAEAGVRRAYLDLVLVRDRLGLLFELENVWSKSAEIARGRYQAGLSAQSDVYRAELEVFRLRQRRFGLLAEERRAIQSLNRMRGKNLDEPIATNLHVEDLPVPPPPALDTAINDAKARSPELSAARLGIAQAKQQIAIAERDRLPDLSVGAAVMPRGSLPPMWGASVSVGLPVWSRMRQTSVVAENQARAASETHSEAALSQTVALQAADRVNALHALGDTIRVYREGLLAQSQATVESTLSQYQVGKVSFMSVLDANVGYLNDREGHLLLVTEAQRIAIAAAEVSLAESSLSASSLSPSTGTQGAPPASAVGNGAGAAVPMM